MKKKKNERLWISAFYKMMILPRVIEENSQNIKITGDGFSIQDVADISNLYKWIRKGFILKGGAIGFLNFKTRFVARFFVDKVYKKISESIKTRPLMQLALEKYFQKQTLAFLDKNEGENCSVSSFGAGIDGTLYRISSNRNSQREEFIDYDLPLMVEFVKKFRKERKFFAKFGATGILYKYLIQDLKEKFIVERVLNKNLFIANNVFSYLEKQVLLDRLEDMKSEKGSEFIFSIGISKGKPADEKVAIDFNKKLDANNLSEYIGDYYSVSELKYHLNNSGWNIEKMIYSRDLLSEVTDDDKLLQIAERDDDIVVIHLKQK